MCQGNQRDCIQQWQGRDAASAQSDRRCGEKRSRSGNTSTEKIRKSATLEQGKEKSWVQNTPREQNCRQTRSFGTIMQKDPRVPTQASPRVENLESSRAEARPSAKTVKKSRKRRASMRLESTADAPARNMRAQRSKRLRLQPAEPES